MHEDKAALVQMGALACGDLMCAFIKTNKFVEPIYTNINAHLHFPCENPWSTSNQNTTKHNQQRSHTGERGTFTRSVRETAAAVMVGAGAHWKVARLLYLANRKPAKGCGLGRLPKDLIRMVLRWYFMLGGGP